MTGVLFILFLIICNGFFAAAEMAFVTARPARLRALADAGNRRAFNVLRVKEDSSNFLAMVQVGVTLVATLASAFGGASTARQLAPALEPLFGAYSEQVALALIVVAITYATLVIGELVPKQLALRNAEGLAMMMVLPLMGLQRLLWLPIHVLNLSTDAILRLTGGTESQREVESAEEISSLVQQAAADGVIAPSEERLIDRVLDYSTTRVVDIMTPRPNLVTMTADQTVQDARELSAESGFSRFPVIESSLDDFLGYIHIKDLLLEAGELPLRRFVREAFYLPEMLYLPVAFRQLTRSKTHMALVLDEYGGLAGVVTLEDMLEEVFGEIEDEYSSGQETVQVLTTDSWHIDGATSVLDVRELTGVLLPESADYNTLAGFVINRFGRLPSVGESVQHEDYRITVAGIEGRRIANLQLDRIAE